MAATRATSKALRLPLGFMVTMAGFETTPAEEMADVDQAPTEPALPSRPVDPAGATAAQLREVVTLIRTLEVCAPDTDWKARAHVLSGVPANALTKTDAEMLIEKLQGELAAFVSRRASDDRRHPPSPGAVLLTLRPP
jgi:hypothetical protein